MASLIVVIMTGLYACNNADASGRYVDLNTGEPVLLKKDSASGLMVNEKTGKPVRIYVDTRTNDTIYGPSGKVINGKIHKEHDGGYVYEDEDLKIKNEGSGEVKIKEGDDYKKKEEGNETKIKSGDKKIKIEDGERKVKKDHHITDKIKKIF